MPAQQPSLSPTAPAEIPGTSTTVREVRRVAQQRPLRQGCSLLRTQATEVAPSGSLLRCVAWSGSSRAEVVSRWAHNSTSRATVSSTWCRTAFATAPPSSMPRWVHGPVTASSLPHHERRTGYWRLTRSDRSVSVSSTMRYEATPRSTQRLPMPFDPPLDDSSRSVTPSNGALRRPCWRSPVSPHGALPLLPVPQPVLPPSNERSDDPSMQATSNRGPVSLRSGPRPSARRR